MVAYLVALLLLTTPVVYAQNNSLQAQVEDRTEKIKQLQSEIQTLQKELDVTGKQTQTLQSAIKSLTLNIQKLTKSITLTQTQIAQRDTEIKSLSGDISNTSQDIGGAQGQIANTLRELNVRDQESFATILLSGATLSAFFDEAATLAALRQSLQGRVEDLSSLKTNLETNKSTAEAKRRDLAALQRKLADEKKGLDISKAAQTQLLKETQNKESAFQAILAQKQAEQSAFEAELFQLASGGGTIDRSLIPSPGSGVLRWPLDNVFITQQFGKTSDSGRLYVSGTHDGIDFRASIGTPVKAARSGIVVEINQGAVAYCQYGKWVLIKHDNGLTTLYAHLSQISVQKGQGVSTGSVIGFAGNTGYSIGPHLHFTVYASEGVSFKQYTCKSGYTVTIPIARPASAYLNPLSYL